MTTLPLLPVAPVPVDLLADTSEIVSAGIIGDWLIFLDADGDLCKLPAPGTARHEALLLDLIETTRQPVAA